MVDLKVLEQFGISPEKWRTLLEKSSADDNFTGGGDSPQGLPLELGPEAERRKKFRLRIRSRVEWGRGQSMDNWPYYYTLDRLWDAPFRQITPTLIASLSQNYKTQEQVLDALKSFNLDISSFLVETQERDAKTGETKKLLNVPAFFNVCVPLVRAYLTIRRAKLINDRNLDPLLKYQAGANTPENRLKAEIITSRVKVMTDQFHHLETLNQAVFQMLLYNWCMVFPREEWYVEEQLRYHDENRNLTSGKPSDEYDEDDERIDGIEAAVTKEGIRHFIPHPTRCYYDRAFSVKTLNTDTGCTFCGHWKVLRFRELKQIAGFFNLDHISVGASDWWTNATHFFNAVMNNCVMNFPNLSSVTVPSDQDRQTWLSENLYYTQDYDDNSVIVYEHYEKFIPRDDGMGDYPYPIWGRFVVAGDGVIIYAAPLGYCPAFIFEDNGDGNRLLDSSLANQLAPYQDQVTNLFTQYLLSVKQNLANLTLVDHNVIKEDMLQKIKNLGERFFRSLNVFTYDGRQMLRSQYGVANAMFSHRFPYLDTNAILQAIRTVLDLAERVLQFSSQEVAQAASHEQTKREVEVIANTTTNILAYTGMPVDKAMEAMGRQNYEALMNYGEDDFFVSIPNEVALSTKKLEQLGIFVLEDTKKPGEKIMVRAKKTSSYLHTFAVTPPLHERTVDPVAAQAMATFMRDLLSNPVTAQAIGPDQALNMANEIAKLAGLPLPAPIRNVGLTAEQQAMQSKEVLTGVINQVMGQVKEGMQPVLEHLKAAELKIDTLYRALNLPQPNVAGGTNSGNGAESQGNPRMVAAS